MRGGSEGAGRGHTPKSRIAPPERLVFSTRISPSGPESARHPANATSTESRQPGHMRNVPPSSTNHCGTCEETGHDDVHQVARDSRRWPLTAGSISPRLQPDETAFPHEYARHLENATAYANPR
jgi:hypothetical protein